MDTYSWFFHYLSTRDAQTAGELLALPTNVVELLHWLLWLTVLCLS